MKKKKIWLTTDKKKFCWVKVFNTKTEMQEAYKKYQPDDGHHDKVDGVHCAYERDKFSKGRWKVSDETGTVLLCKQRCGAGVVTHEFMHAVFWARQCRLKIHHYPIKIESMKEEEKLLHNHTYAVTQFYNWYWDNIKGKKI